MPYPRQTTARVALRILQDGDFAPGLPFAVTVLTDVAIEAGELNQAEALLNLLPRDGWQPGVGTVLIPAARGRLRLAQGRAAEALGDFQTCASMFSSEVWGTEIRDVGYLRAHQPGQWRALLLLGQRQRAQNEAEAHLAELEVFGTPRALGIAPAVRRTRPGRRPRTEASLGDVGDPAPRLAGPSRGRARCADRARGGATPSRTTGGGPRCARRSPRPGSPAAAPGALTSRAHEELRVEPGARPRRVWRTGLEALTPSELRIVRLAAAGHSDRGVRARPLC